MALTLGLTGMDPATEASLKAAFADANARLGLHWRLASETEADHVVVDMDSMYGPMSWLRLHAAGKHVIGLTAAARTQTDFRLARPFDRVQVEQLLRDLARHDGVQVERNAGGDFATDATPAMPVPPAGPTPAPAPQDQLPKEDLGDAEVVAPPEAEPVPAVTEPPPRDPVFADWLLPGALDRRVRYSRPGGPTLLIDPAGQIWHGPTALKPIAAYFEGTVEADDFETVDDARWAAESAAAGAAQPLSRLHWLGGLTAGRGALLPGLDPDGRYVLTKWPQTEREYPKHFRIATAMMKGPATVAEIAETSGMPAEDVADFINANLATGYAEPVSEPVPEPEEPAKPSGLFGRLRNR